VRFVDPSTTHEPRGQDQGPGTLVPRAALRVALSTISKVTTEHAAEAGTLRARARDAVRRALDRAIDSGALPDASEARVRALSDGSPIGVYETDCRGSLVYANDRMQTIWDVTHSELSDGRWIERVLPSDAARFVAWLQDPAGRASSREDSFHLLSRDGATRHVRIRSVPRLDGDGKVIGIVGTVEMR